MSLGTEYDNRSRNVSLPKIRDMENITEFNLKQDELKEDFKQKLFEMHGIENHRKRVKCFNLAWDYGHSNGYEIVEEYFNDFVEFLK